MATRAREVMRDAATLLQDVNHVRWKLPELRIYLNAGLREIALRKPTAKTAYRYPLLVAGTLQAAPESALGVLKVIRNVQGPAAPIVGLAAIRMVARADMDAQDPDWHDPAVYPPQRAVRHAMIDPDDTRHFFVWPPNDGTGRVELLTSEMPRPVAAPDNGREIAQYGEIIDIDDVYINALTQYVVHRAYAKDAQAAGNAARSAAAYGMFADALGVKTSMEIATTPAEGARQ